ncbi:MAG: tetratricopeptide repeat protein [Coleofasciculaceae cyanobacterium]
MRGFFKLTNPEKPLGGRYKIIKQLAAGGFGQTFLAEDMHLPGDPRCVVKQLKPQVSDDESLQTARRLFDTEARVLYQLGNHDQIPRLLAHFEENQEFYLAQELIEGEPLSEELEAGQCWPEQRVIALLQDILNVLSFVHQQGVIHRDIKPSNLMRRRQDDRVVLIDFGAVKQVSTQMVNPKTGKTNMTISIGTQGYMPKEQLGGNPRFSSDIYAVGMIGIQALTGVHPRRLTEDLQTGEINWQNLVTQVSPEIVDFLDHMVRYDFRARYQTGTEALEALHSLPKQLLSSAPPPPPFPSTKEITASQEIYTPATATGPTVPAERELANHSPVASSTKPTEFIASPEPNLPSPAKSVSTFVSPASGQEKFLKPAGLVLMVLVVVGGLFWTTKTLILPQLASQDSSNSGVVADNQNTNTEQSEPTNTTDDLASDKAKANTTEQSETANTDNSAGSSPKTSPAQEEETNTTASPVVATPTPSVAASPVSKPATPSPAQQATELLKKADNQREAGQYAPALKLYEQAIKLNSDVPEAHWGHCYSLNALGRAAEGSAACDEALALKPNYPEALWSKGSALEQQKRYLEAVNFYEQALALKQDFPELWNNQGTALLALDRPTEAIAAFDRAIALKQDFAAAWANRGAALWFTGKREEARASVQQALKIDPQHANAQNLSRQMQ